MTKYTVDAKQNVDHCACILDFEREAIAFDKRQGKQAINDGEHLIEYVSMGHGSSICQGLFSHFNIELGALDETTDDSAKLTSLKWMSHIKFRWNSSTS